jgi:hypothetical protein
MGGVGNYSSASRSTRYLLPTPLNIRSEHHQHSGVPSNVYHPGVVRAWATYDLNDRSGWYSHGDSLFAAGINGESSRHQTKAFAG